MWIFWTIIIGIVGVLLFLYSCTGDGWQGFAGQCYAWCMVVIIELANTNATKPMPTALDVYRGNTELVITSVNEVLTDSVVVFKNK